MVDHSFGGDWTSEKLQYLKKYLHAYTTALKKQSFHLSYIDAFAGTGWISLKQSTYEETELPLFSSLVDSTQETEDEKRGKEGSARIALQVEPYFNEYVFIEKDYKRFSELLKLKSEFQDRNINCINDDANHVIKNICQNWQKRNHRGVMFLDPYGMSVNWSVIEDIAATESIDLWYLFPLGVALNRLLKKDGQISQANKQRIDGLLGTEDWYNVFYEASLKENLFERTLEIKKTADFDSISKYLVTRFAATFPMVAENPKMLFNKKNNPLYLLIFASGNPRGSQLAVKIASNILDK